MTLVVPRSSRGLGALLRKLSDDPDFLKGIYKRMRVDNVRVVLPRFRIKSAVDWGNVLNKVVGLFSIKVFSYTYYFILENSIGILDDNQKKRYLRHI